VVSVTPRPRFAPERGPPVPIVQEAGWASEPVWTQRLKEKSFAPAGELPLDFKELIIPTIKTVSTGFRLTLGLLGKKYMVNDVCTGRPKKCIRNLDAHNPGINTDTIIVFCSNVLE
jgi:hypothetical protein